jgi:hypothetical protein
MVRTAEPHESLHFAKVIMSITPNSGRDRDPQLHLFFTPVTHTIAVMKTADNGPKLRLLKGKRNMRQTMQLVLTRTHSAVLDAQ